MNAGLYVLALLAAGVVIAWVLGKIVDSIEDRSDQWRQDWDSRDDRWNRKDR